MTSIYLRVDGCSVTGTRLYHVYLTGLFAAVKPVPAVCVSPERVCRQLFHHLALFFDRSTRGNNRLQLLYLVSIFSTAQPLCPFTEHVCRRQPARMRSFFNYYKSILYLVSDFVSRKGRNKTIHKGKGTEKEKSYPTQPNFILVNTNPF